MFVLKKRAEFLRLRKGRKVVTRGFILQMEPRNDEVCEHKSPRFGFTVSKKVGNAVERNRVKRRFRELVRELSPELAQANADYVLIGRRVALKLPFFLLRKDLIYAFKKISK